MKRFVVVGLGNFGASAAETLFESGHDVIAVDVDERKVDRIAPFVSQAAVGDGSELTILERLGAKSADAGLVSTGDDITASVLTTLALRDCGVEEIYVKVVSANHARVMERLGVTDTVFPERDSAHRLAKRISARTLLNFVELGPGFAAQEMAVPEQWIGKALRDLELPRRFGISVIALHDVLAERYDAIPDADAKLKDSDTLILAGTHDNLARVAKLK